MKYDLKKEKIAVHCQTLEEAEKVVDKMLESGIELIPDVSKNETINWFNGNYAFFFSDFKCKIDCWEGREAAINKSYQIIQASEYLSQFEEAPKYGDKVWVRDNEEHEWKERIFIDLCKGKCRCVADSEEKLFKTGGCFNVISWKHYRTTDPAKDKKVLELTLSEIAEKLGVDEIKIKE